jgi:hypothetical protein
VVEMNAPASELLGGFYRDKATWNLHTVHAGIGENDVLATFD